MAQQTDWQRILFQCEGKIEEEVARFLQAIGQPEPDLGYGAGGDLIKQVDLAAEKAVVDTLEKHGVSFTLISEESGVREYGMASDGCYVTTDPIDGSTNLTRGLPFYASSIAVSTAPILSTVHTGLVADLPRGVSYYAQKGKGAYRNGKRIIPSKLSLLEEAVIGVDFNTFRIGELIPMLADILQNTRHLRHFGANALELCYVADGTIDAFIDLRGRLRTTDMAAASLIIREAGAQITTSDGKPLDVRLDPRQKVSFIAAANDEIHKIILKSLQRKRM